MRLLFIWLFKLQLSNSQGQPLLEFSVTLQKRILLHDVFAFPRYLASRSEHKIYRSWFSA